MLLNDVRLQKPSSVVITAGGLSLMVGSLLLTASAFSVYRIKQTQDISVSPAAWSWISETRFQLDRGQEFFGPLLSESEIPEHTLVGPPAPLVLAMAKTAPSPKVSRGKAQTKPRWLAKAKAVFRRPKLTPQEPESKAAVVVPTSGATENELNTLQSLHQQLRGKFILAMTTQPAMADILVAQMAPQKMVPSPEAAPADVSLEKSATEVAPEPLAFHSLRKKKVHRQENPAPASADDAIIANEESSAPAEVKEATVPAVTTHAEPMAAEAQVAAKDDLISSSQSAPLVRSAAVVEPAVDYSTVQTPTDPIKEQVVKEVQAPASLETTTTETTKILVASGTQRVWVATTATNAKAPSSKVNNHVAAPAPSPIQPAPSPQEPPSDTRLASTNARALSGTQALLSAEAADDYSNVTVNSQVNTPLTEAFDWVSPVSGGSTSFVSKEMGDRHPGWVLAQAQDHWPTLSRRDTNAVPLISKNTGKLLSTLAGASLQPEAGVLFGKLPLGWSVRLSGRSERAVFLNDRNQSISPSNLEGERYFAFLNVAPGAHLLYLTDRAGLEQGAIGVAILSGTSTFADVSAIKRTTFTGRILDGSDAKVRPMSGITVRVLGAINARAETDRSGKFSVENVLTVGDFPVYVETDATSGYTHRYQLHPGQLQSTTLYRLSETAIQMWVNQLEGAISPDSGIVIAATPGVLSGLPPKAKLIPSVRSYAPNATLRPEVYSLSSSGQMQVGQPMDAQTTRFISVQVPEGPAVAHLIDAQKNLVWSEMMMVSPAVVNIVGPF